MLQCYKSGAGTLRSCFHVRLACEVWLVRAWNHSALYTSAPTKCSQQAGLHSLTLLAHTYSRAHTSHSSYIPAPIWCQTGVIYRSIYLKKNFLSALRQTLALLLVWFSCKQGVCFDSRTTCRITGSIHNLLMGLNFVQTVANVFQKASICQTKLWLITLRVDAFHSARPVPEGCYCARRLTGMAYWGT